MNPRPPDKRLRDHAGDPSDPLNRAGDLVRALPPPPTFDVAARARVRAALFDRGPGGRPRHGPRLYRVAAQLGAVLAVAATSFGAWATLDWWQDRARPVPPPVAAPEPTPVTGARAPAPAPAVAAVAPPLPAPPRQAPPRAPVARSFTRARLAIDPQSAAFRPRLSPEIAQAHAKKGITTLVEVCISAAGGVTSASVLEQRHPRVDRAIAAAVRRWRWRPAERDGTPIPSCSQFRYRHSWLAGGS
jgi:TonB family protein